MPTGSGKSLVLAEFLRRLVTDWPGTRALLTTHVRELVTQDHEKLVALLGDELVGVNSAGLKRRDHDHPVICAGLQSVCRPKQIARLGRFDVLVIDECHLVPNERAGGMYHQLISGLRLQNPALRVVGLTATAFRTRGGYLHAKGPHRIFTDVAHSVSLERLIEEGWLARLRPKETQVQADVSKVKTVAGDFKQGELAAVMSDEVLLGAALDEAVAEGADRQHWLAFACCTVDHARLVRDGLRRRGITTELVHGQTKPALRDARIRDYREGRVRCLVNVNVLTTGFDAPATDLLLVLRPTKSPVLYVQMFGRGMRTAPGKTDCLVLDFGGNVERHGALNRLRVRKGPPKPGKVEREPVRTCPECQTQQPLSNLVCEFCGFEFPPPERDDHERTASTQEIVASEARVRVLAVSSVTYTRHEKAGKPPSLRATYLLGLQVISTWHCFDHGGWPAEHARAWWERRAGTIAPHSTEEALARVPELRRPAALRIREDGKKWIQVEAELDEEAWTMAQDELLRPWGPV